MMGSLRLATIILAAGQSKRMGSISKLLMRIEDRPMIQRVVDVAIEAGSSDIYVVTGFERDRIESRMSGYSVNFVHNESFRAGMGNTIAQGVKAIFDQGFEGAMILLGDLPYLRADTVIAVAESFVEHEGRKIVIPKYQGNPGHPVVFPKAFFNELTQLSGDRGARAVYANQQSSVARIEVEDPGATRDLDTPPARLS